MVDVARMELLQALRALPRGAGPDALRPLAVLFEAAVDMDDDVDLRFRDELIRVLGAVMAEHTPVTIEDAAASATGVEAAVLVATLPRLRVMLAQVRGLKAFLTAEALEMLTGAEALLREVPVMHTRQQLEAAVNASLARLAAELSRLHAPVAVLPEDALHVARWMLGSGPPPRGAAVLELARGLDSFCHRAPLSPPDLESLRSLARRADQERDTAGWPLMMERLRTVRPRLLPRRAVPPLYRSLAGVQARTAGAPASLEALLRE
ncbi:hypothetical protein JY651_04875 [Pyxidicoccus parkwayensis]|uniref:Uncharacterized protein n=1 Tax=Pyxidicoccus parkwayensis TaxID=2813578 RepID=A0ABX7NZR6_9BACT|nr:hypothetical protein [Pyxidicoccus parkwaysis]QSQ24305.1 hypothetical protein JY651_04875 [Pyxidicoccus parkwaysis]